MTQRRTYERKPPAIEYVCIDEDIWTNIGGNLPFGPMKGFITKIYEAKNALGEPVVILMFDSGQELQVPSRRCMVVYRVPNY